MKLVQHLRVRNFWNLANTGNSSLRLKEQVHATEISYDSGVSAQVSHSKILMVISLRKSSPDSGPAARIWTLMMERP